MTAPAVRSLRRERLLETLGGVSEGRLALVIAPAGSGKTTLLAEFADSSPLPVAWYRAETDDAATGVILHGLATALEPVLATAVAPDSVDDLIAAADGWTGAGAVLVVDDLHTIVGTPGETVLERLVDDAPPTLRFVFASRCLPRFNLSRLRVSGSAIEIGPDDLRFRSWEVERLFRDFYGERLPPEDLAELARRTEGWAAGLQLFHLATRGKPIPERRRILAQLGAQSGMVQEYLARNVLDDLPDELRHFLVRTCVLRRLTGRLCDELLGGTGSEAVLRRLAREQIFTVGIDGGTGFRYHEVLRSHLEGVLVAEVGEGEARQCHRRAGELLQRTGALPEALWAYCRAGDWHAAADLLGRNGAPMSPGQGAWIDALPSGLLEQDPWLVLAKARRFLELGHWPAALEAYRSAEARFPQGPGHDTCGRERRALALWLEPSPAPRVEWLGLLRSATQGDPLEAAAQAHAIPGASGRFAEAVALLLAGRVADGRRALEFTRELPDISLVLGAVARLAAGAAAFVSTGRLPGDWDVIVEEALAVGLSWAAMLARTIGGFTEGPEPATARPMVDRCEVQGDHWGAALLVGAEAFARLIHGLPAADLFGEAALRFRHLDAGTLEIWARAGRALGRAREGSPTPEETLAVQALARGRGVPGALVLTFFAQAVAAGPGEDRYAALAAAAADECGLSWPADVSPPARPPVNGAADPAGGPGGGVPAGPVPTAALRCFGGFDLRLGGTAVDVTTLKPRPRAALQLLALHAGGHLHRERLVDALWPGADAAAGVRNLQVVVSTLRRLLESLPAGTGTVQIAREGDSYRLVLPSGAAVDVALFTAADAAWRRCRRQGDVDGAMAAAEEALRLYTGDLLPEAGTAEWVVEGRERFRREATDAAVLLGELGLERREFDRAVEACEAGLDLDRYRDALWRSLAAACDALGDSASAARARQAYGEVLGELGVAVVTD